MIPCRRSTLFILLLIFALVTVACSGDDDDPTSTPDVGLDDVEDEDVDTNGDSHPFSDVEKTESWTLPELSGEVYVLRSEGNMAHIYAEDDIDAARVHGFVAARDRFFMMDLTRRLGLGKATELLGDAALETDIENRMYGAHHVADQILAAAPPDVLAVMEAYAEGVNHYIGEAIAGNLPYPSEVELAWELLQLDGPQDMLVEFSSRDIAGMLATFIYQTSFSSRNVGRAHNFAQLENLFEGHRFEELRRAGVIEDISKAPHPIYEIASGEWGPLSNIPSTGLTELPDLAPEDVLRAESSLLERLSTSIEGHHHRRGHRDDEKGAGSNAWAVSGDHTPDGDSLMAADGHLSLGIPPILYNIGIDTSVLSGNTDPGSQQLGMVIPGMPYIALGTNGHVAWAFTQLFGDITDWYVEEIQLDDDGLPKAAFFDGDWVPLVAVEETYEVAEVPLLGSEEATETLTRWETEDGRWIVDFEGTSVNRDDVELEPGQSVVRTLSDWIVPGDVDDSGTVTAISIAYAGHQMDDLMGTFAKLGQSSDVLEFREAVRGMLASSFNFVASDSGGDIFYTAFQGTPCRSYLPRDANGDFADGANPMLLLDGTQYKSFTIPTADGVVDDSHREDPYRCIVPFDESPQAYNPDSGYILTANNDPAGISFDRNLFSDPWYIGGPWYPGFRAETIDRHLQALIAEDRADLEAMSELQSNVESPLGRIFTPHLLAAIDIAEEIHENSPVPIELEDWEQRVLDDYTPRRDQLLAAADRLEAWSEGGFQARSGVDTFYADPDQQDRDDAVATMIFNSYFRAFVDGVLGNEAIPGVWQRGGSVGRTRLLYEMLESRGDDNPLGLASFNDDTGESIFFDNRHTDELERSDELMVRSLVAGLDFLAGEPEDDNRGGFGTDDMDQWLWGLRHQVVFESLLGDFLGNDPMLSIFIDDFSINTDRLPLADDLDVDDPRRDLDWFPRDGDQYNVDAANPGISGSDFTYSSGPVMRMVVSLNDGDVSGVNIIPGGQSALIDSEFFDDQAQKWLGNETYPLRFHLEDVIDGATGMEVYSR